MAARELDSIFSQVCLSIEELSGVILFSTKGGVYTYRCFLDDANIVSFAMKYGKADETPGRVTWLGTATKPEFSSEYDVDMMGTVLCDTNYVKDQRLLATVYLIFENNYFGKNITSTGASTLMLYDEYGKLVMSTGKQELANIWNVSLEAGQKIFGSDMGDFQIKLGGETYLVTFYKSPTTGWRYVRTDVYKEYFKNFKGIQYIMILLIICVLGIILLVNYYFVKRITKPIKEIVYAMKEVGNQNFDITVNVHSNDEFSVISNGFNAMVTRLGELFTRVVHEERKRKDADIMALQYQMTPHFLYNTLSSIRLNAYVRGEYETSEMLLLMGRFLRSTINNAGRMVKISEEISNIEDYVSLYKIRHENRFSSSCEVDEDIREYKIPAMMIQPLVENAIFHGLNSKLDGVYHAEVRLKVCRHKDDIRIIVWDNGIGISPEKIAQLYVPKDKNREERMHIGIANIQTRIHDLFGNTYGIRIESELDKFTQVELILPQISDDESFVI